MSMPTRAASILVALSSALTLAACSQEAESAQTEEQVSSAARVEPAAPAAPETPVAAAPAAEPAPVVVAAPAKPAPAKPTPRPAAPASPAAAPAPARPAPFLAAGTEITTSVQEELTTEKTRAGDRFHAVLADDVLGANGEVMLPRGAVVNGRVAESRESTGASDPAVLRLEVESVVVDGRTLPLPADVVALDAEIGTRDSAGKTAIKVGAGAAAGAVIGRILGGDKSSTAKGAAAGAAVGAAAAIATKDGQAVIKPGAKMVVKLTDRLVISEPLR